MEYKDADSFDDFDSESNLTPLKPVADRAPAPTWALYQASSAEQAKN